MPCNFAGVFYVYAIQNRTLQTYLVDESDSLQHVNMTYFAPSTLTDEPNPFLEEEPIQVPRVYFISGIMAIENGNYVSPLVITLHVKISI